ncbi:protein KASH5-like [Acipenser ruthenus]|uniref:protein KASH5-like n=1 Tax=Acipenser ruthenus TaxID=7906 RepID=UPI0027414B08|nr:protein KASH5-like [Acipenser ruthenus]
MRRHTKQLEREQQAMTVETRCRQEESVRLAAERDTLRWRVEQLTEDKAELKILLDEVEDTLSSKDAVITERGRETERLQQSIEEYVSLIQELKAEISRLQDQLTQSYNDLTACSPQESLLVCSSLPWRDRTEGSLPWRDRTESSLPWRDRTEGSLPWRDRTESSLQLEIQDVHKDTHTVGSSLPTPLCGMLVNEFNAKGPSLLRNPGLENNFLQQSGEQDLLRGESRAQEGGSSIQSIPSEERGGRNHREVQTTSSSTQTVPEDPADPQSPVTADWSEMQLVPVVRSLVPVSRQLVQFRRTTQGNRLSEQGRLLPLSARSCLSCIGLACAILLVSLCSLLYQSAQHSFNPAANSPLASLWHLIIQTLRPHITLRHLSPPPI